EETLLLRRYASFFFSSRRRHTRFDCDWSSDVCSSDLACPTPVIWLWSVQRRLIGGLKPIPERGPPAVQFEPVGQRRSLDRPESEIGRASCREREGISWVAGSVSFKRSAVCRSWLCYLC